MADYKIINDFQMNSTTMLPAFRKSFEKEEFERWKKLMTAYFIFNKITEDKAKVACLHLAGGEEMLELLDNLATPSEEMVNSTFIEDSERTEYNKLLLTLGKYIEKVENPMKCKMEFRQLKQIKGEKIREYELRLRTQARKCGYEKELENEVMTQLLTGTNDTEIMGRAMEKKFKDVAELIAFGEIREAVREAIAQQNESVFAINENGRNEQPHGEIGQSRGRNKKFQNRGKRTSQRVSCYNCDSEEHLAAKCPEPKKCFTCGKLNHIARNCRSTALVQATFKREREEEAKPMSLKKFKSENEEMVNLIGGGKTVEAEIGQVKLTMNIDTGTQSNIIGVNGWKLLAAKDATVFNIEEQPNKKFIPYGAQDSLQAEYSFSADIKVGTVSCRAKFFVVNVEAQNLIGMETAEQLELVSFNVSTKIYS